MTPKTHEHTADRETVIPADERRIMHELTCIGISSVEERLLWLSNYNEPVELNQVRVGYVDPNAANRTFRDIELVGGRVHLRNVPFGYALVLFPVESANNAASLLLSTTVDDLGEVSVEMARSALTELTSMFINGFFDEWANKFGEEITLSEPEPVHNTEREILSNTIGGIEEFGIYLAARVQLEDHGITGLTYLFPHNVTVLELASRLNPEDFE
jgi:chemotaxis protein CheY-P-specific phosphatase CheC